MLKAMHSKAILFDLYQTLINVDASREKEGKEAGFREIVAPYLRQKGVPEPKASLVQQRYSDELRNFYKNHDSELYQHNFPVILSTVFNKHYGLDVSDTEINDLIYEFRKISRCFLTLYEGSREALNALSSHYTLAVASHTQGVYTERELEELDILKYFQYRIYSSDIGFKKTSDKFYQSCLEVVGLGSKDCLMVGDNLYEDMYMARKNGLHTVWIINPLTKDKDKADIKPEASLPIEDIKELPSVINNILG